MQPCDVAVEYVSRIQAGHYTTVAELFADDAVFRTPTGKVLRGAKEINAFYSSMLTRLRPVIRAASFVHDDTVCVMELEGRMAKDEAGHWTPSPTGQFMRVAIDRFTINPAGKVATMTVYLPPPNLWSEEQQPDGR